MFSIFDGDIVPSNPDKSNECNDFENYTFYWQGKCDSFIIRELDTQDIGDECERVLETIFIRC